MRSHALFILVVVLFTVFALAWTPEDHEIFRIRDELNTLEGEDINFYEFLGVPVGASLDDINKQYRKRSRQLHPDKAIPGLLAARELKKSQPGNNVKKPGVNVAKGPSARERAAVTKQANDRYAHFGVIANILRGPTRERYDYFLKNGFPLWRGTGYYYSRFRPGLGSVLLGLFLVFGGGMHYVAMYISWRRQKEFVARYVKHARRVAGSDVPVPGLNGLASNTAQAQAAPVIPDEEEDQNGGMALNRRQKRMQEKDGKRKDVTKATRKARLTRGKNDDKDESSADDRPQISAPMEPEIISGPTGSRKKVIAENGKVLIVDSAGNVYLEEKTTEGQVHEFLLDPEEIPKPSIMQTAVVRLPVWLYSQSVGRAIGQMTGSRAGDEPLLDEAGENALDVNMTEEEQQEGAIEAAIAPNANGEARKRKGTKQQR